MTSPVRRESPALSHPAPTRGQMSHANGIDRLGRGRSVQARRRAQVLPVITVSRRDAISFWSQLLARRCGSRERAAVMFDVTFQTACNWWDGFSVPTGDKVLQAMRWWPEDFLAEEGRGGA